MRVSQFGLVLMAVLLFIATGCGRASQSTVSAEKDELSAYLAENGDDTDLNADDGND